MAETSLLEVATPESLLVRDQVSEAQIPARNGYVGILPGHAALLAGLGEGRLSLHGRGPPPVFDGPGRLAGSGRRPRPRAGERGGEGRVRGRLGTCAPQLAALR
jgi:hypothetical protein